MRMGVRVPRLMLSDVLHLCSSSVPLVPRPVSGAGSRRFDLEALKRVCFVMHRYVDRLQNGPMPMDYFLYASARLRLMQSQDDPPPVLRATVRRMRGHGHTSLLHSTILR